MTNLFEMAADLGEPNPYDMARKLPSSIFTDWIAFYANTGPATRRRIDIAGGQVVQALANIHRLRGTPGKTLEKFVIKWGGAASRKKSPDQLKQIAKQINAQLGGTFTKREK